MTVLERAWAQTLVFLVLLAVTLALLGLFQWLLGARATGVWSQR